MPKSNQSAIDELRAEAAAERARLAHAAREVADSLKPSNIARDGVEQVKQFAKTEFTTFSAQFRDDEDGWKTDKVLLVGGAVLGGVILMLSISRIARSRQLTASARRELPGG